MSSDDRASEGTIVDHRCPLKSRAARLVVGLLLSALWARGALAQTTTPRDTEHAEELFSQALRLMQADHCQGAIPLFLESQRTDPAAGTLANIATCYARLGRTGSAYSTYLQAAQAASLENKPTLQQQANQAAAALLPVLTRLRVVTLDSSVLPELKINGRIIRDWSDPIPLDPGESTIEASAEGYEPWRRVLSAQGDGALLVLEVPSLRRYATGPKQAFTSLDTRSPGPVSNRRMARTDLGPYAVIAASVGVTGLALGTVFALNALSKQNSADAYCDGRYCTPTGLHLQQQANDRATIASWSALIGVVGLGTAATLWFLSPSNHQDVQGLALSPWFGPRFASAGIGLEGKL